MREIPKYTKMKQQRFADIFQAQVESKPDLYRPLRIQALEFEPAFRGNNRPDAIVVVEIDEKQTDFVVEFDAQSTPKSVQSTASQAIRYAEEANGEFEAAVLVRHLSEGIVEELEHADISAMDLNGNYYLRAPGLVAIRLDQKNEYPRSRMIQNVYAGKSSLVGRLLLDELEIYEQVQAIHEKIQALGGNISLSTVSKALRGLAEDLIIEKQRGHIRLLQPAKLLRRLKENYQSPDTDDVWRLNLPDQREQQEELLGNLIGGATHWVWSGDTSAEAYTPAPPPSVRTAYTRRNLESDDDLAEYRDERFYNCIIEQTRDEVVYFNPNGFWADDVETYLQLAQGDKRERDIAADVETRILNRFEA